MSVFGSSRTENRTFDNYAQNNECISEIYRLIDNKNGGELFELAREAYLTKNDKILDDYIQKNVPQFLLNNGKGEWVNIKLSVGKFALYF